MAWTVMVYKGLPRSITKCFVSNVERFAFMININCLRMKRCSFILHNDHVMHDNESHRSLTTLVDGIETRNMVISLQLSDHHELCWPIPNRPLTMTRWRRHALPLTHVECPRSRSPNILVMSSGKISVSSGLTARNQKFRSHGQEEKRKLGVVDRCQKLLYSSSKKQRITSPNNNFSNALAALVGSTSLSSTLGSCLVHVDVGVWPTSTVVCTSSKRSGRHAV